MKLLMKLILITFGLFVLSGCDTATDFECGEGTTLSEGACIPNIENDIEIEVTCGEGTILTDGVCLPDVDNSENPVTAICDSGPGAYQVVNEDFINPPAEPWFFIGGWMVSQPDSIWMQEFDALIFDVTDQALAERNVWDGAFWQPKVYTEAGCTYTVSFTLRTDETAGRDVIVFLEDTDANYVKLIEETVTLTTEYQTFTYVYEAPVTNDDTKIGIFFANDVGTVIIDAITVDRSLTE